MRKCMRVLLIAAALVPMALPASYADEAALETKLREISEKQDQILSELEALKSELNIVKIRVSSR